MSNFFSNFFSSPNDRDIKNTILKIINDKDITIALQTTLGNIVKDTLNDPAFIIALSKMHFLWEMNNQIEYQYLNNNLSRESIQKVVNYTANCMINFQIYNRVFSELYNKINDMQDIKQDEVNKLSIGLCEEVICSLSA